VASLALLNRTGEKYFGSHVMTVEKISYLTSVSWLVFLPDFFSFSLNEMSGVVYLLSQMFSSRQW
jgi:hypothetical protein